MKMTTTRFSRAGQYTYFYHCPCKNYNVKQVSDLIGGGGVGVGPDPRTLPLDPPLILWLKTVGFAHLH